MELQWAQGRGIWDARAWVSVREMLWRRFGFVGSSDSDSDWRVDVWKDGSGER
jgi:hypothetical protein